MYKLSRILEFKIFEHDKDLYIFAFVYFRIYEDNEFKVDHSQFRVTETRNPNWTRDLSYIIDSVLLDHYCFCPFIVVSLFKIYNVHYKNDFEDKCT
jgi:hypothetical protein